MRCRIPGLTGHFFFALLGATASFAQTPGTLPDVPFPEVTDVDHAALIRAWDDKAFERGRTLYSTVCFACHGIDGKKVTVQGARAFAVDPLKKGIDPYSLFKVVTFGFGTMPQQLWMTPAQRYDVVHYIREAFLKDSNPSQYAKIDKAYLSGLPKPTGPSAVHDGTKAKEKDFGPVLCTNLNREFSAVLNHRLPGDVTVSYDLLRMQLAGAWTGGFLDLENTRFYRQRGEAPAKPVGTLVAGLQTWKWAYDGSFDYGQLPPRSPAPEKFMRFLGHYVHGDQGVMSYRIGGTGILEMPQAEVRDGRLVFRHTLQIEPGGKPLMLCVAELGAASAAGVLPAGTMDVAGKPAGPAAGTIAVLTAEKTPAVARESQARFVASAKSTLTPSFAWSPAGEKKTGPATPPAPDEMKFYVAGAVLGDTDGLRWEIEGNRRLVLHIAPGKKPRTIQILRHSGEGESSCLAARQRGQFLGRPPLGR